MRAPCSAVSIANESRQPFRNMVRAWDPFTKRSIEIENVDLAPHQTEPSGRSERETQSRLSGRAGSTAGRIVQLGPCRTEMTANCRGHAMTATRRRDCQPLAAAAQGHHIHVH